MLCPCNNHAAACRTYAKGFGAVGAIFAGSECVIEKMRAKHDMYNSVYAGCFTGGVLAARAGPQVGSTIPSSPSSLFSSRDQLGYVALISPMYKSEILSRSKQALLLFPNEAKLALPQAMCAGCATFAAFSAMIDHFMEH